MPFTVIGVMEVPEEELDGDKDVIVGTIVGAAIVSVCGSDGPPRAKG